MSIFITNFSVLICHIDISLALDERPGLMAGAQTNFPAQKILELKISNPKNSFDHPDHLKSAGVEWLMRPLVGY